MSEFQNFNEPEIPIEFQAYIFASLFSVWILSLRINFQFLVVHNQVIKKSSANHCPVHLLLERKIN